MERKPVSPDSRYERLRSRFIRPEPPPAPEPPRGVDYKLFRKPLVELLPSHLGKHLYKDYRSITLMKVIFGAHLTGKSCFGVGRDFFVKLSQALVAEKWPMVVRLENTTNKEGHQAPQEFCFNSEQEIVSYFMDLLIPSLQAEYEAKEAAKEKKEALKAQKKAEKQQKKLEAAQRKADKRKIRRRSHKAEQSM